MNIHDPWVSVVLAALNVLQVIALAYVAMLSKKHENRVKNGEDRTHVHSKSKDGPAV